MRYAEQFAKRVVTADPTDTLATVAHLMEQHNVGSVVIVDNLRPVGILTDRDLALELGARGTSAHTPAVRVMSTPLETVEQGEGVFGATRAMLERQVRRLAVIDGDGLLAGIITLDDLLRLLSRELSNLSEGIAPEMQVK
jgi:CBS domain-containing protein